MFSQAQRVKVSGADGSAAYTKVTARLGWQGNELLNQFSFHRVRKNVKFLLFLKWALDSTLCGAKFKVFGELISA